MMNKFFKPGHIEISDGFTALKICCLFHLEVPGPPIANPVLRTVSPNYAFEIQTPEGFLSPEAIIHDMNQGFAYALLILTHTICLKR